MLKKNESPEELPEVPAEETDIEEEDEDFDGPMNVIELENDDFDDWHGDIIDDIPTPSKTTATPKSTVLELDKKRIDKAILPTKYMCSLSKQLMTDPVRIAGSKVPVAYERAAIEAHYEEHGTDPMTHEYLEDDVVFIPDLALKREISDFCVQQKWVTES